MPLLSTPSPAPVDSLVHGWDGPTIVTLLIALASAGTAIWALHLQRRDHQERATADRVRHRQSQARLITLWYEEARDLIWVENRSDQPIHDVGVTLQQPKPNEPRSLTLHGTGGIFPILPPHHKVHFAPRNYLLKKTPTLVFRDALGVIWKRDDRSDLVELDQDVFAYYEVGPPERYNYLADRPEPL